MPENPRLHFRYTQKEWSIIEKRIKKTGKADLNSFLRGNIHRIGAIIDDCPECVKEATGPTIKKSYAMPPELHRTICLLAGLLGIEPSSLVSRVIIDPLLIGE